MLHIYTYKFKSNIDWFYSKMLPYTSVIKSMLINEYYCNH